MTSHPDHTDALASRGSTTFAEELDSLVRAIRFGSGYSLYFAESRSRALRHRVCDLVEQQLPELEIKRIHFSEPITDLLSELKKAACSPSLAAIFATGIEYTFQYSHSSFRERFLANINATRDSFPAAIHTTLVLWIDEDIHRVLSQAAPDFYSVRSGVFFFDIPGAPVLDLPRYWHARVDRTKALPDIELTVKALSDLEGSVAAESQPAVLARKASLLIDAGRLSEARDAYARALVNAEDVKDERVAALCLNGLGVVHRYLGNWDAGAELLVAAKERASRIGAPDVEAKALINLGSVYRDSLKWEYARTAVGRALEIARAIDAYELQASALVNLGNIFFAQGDDQGAEVVYTDAIQLCERIGSWSEWQAATANLGNILLKRGDASAALGIFSEQLVQARSVADRVGEAVSLTSLAGAHYYLGESEKSRRFLEDAISILEGTENKLELEHARYLLRTFHELTNRAEVNGNESGPDN